MSVSDIINEYLSVLKATAKELSATSGLSVSVISRYKSGERSPMPGSEQMLKLIAGLKKLAAQNGNKQLSERGLEDELLPKQKDTPNTEQLVKKLNLLITTLSLNVNDIARSLNYDPSYISKIRNGHRIPSDSVSFAYAISRYVSQKINDEVLCTATAKLIGCERAELSEEYDCIEKIKNWLCTGNYETDENVSSFLHKMDDFNLNEYVKAIKFDEIKIPNIPFQIPVSKNYYGLREMCEGELDFLRSVILSKSTDDIYMCSDMQMDDMASDMEFVKKWMMGIAVILKKGHQLNMIHNLDRPFHELMIGLESWIPLYMTGQIKPYYLRGTKNSVYGHLNYSASNVALCGECITGHHSDGRYHLTKFKEEVAYYRKKAKNLFGRAYPLMEILRADESEKIDALFIAEQIKGKHRRGIRTVPPSFTISKELLTKIAVHHDLPEKSIQALLESLEKTKNAASEILKTCRVSDEIAFLSREEFDEFPIAIPMKATDKELFYTWDDYCEHLEETRLYDKQNENYTATFRHVRIFNNIEILICEGEWAVIIKNRSPSMYFLIRQPRLRKSIENMVLPLTES